MDRAVQRFTDRSREMRRASTDAESLLWGILRNRRFLGLKFRRQHEIEKRFIVDFYCPELHLAIELDGAPHFSEPVEQFDAKRSRALNRLGIIVIRFRNDEVIEQTNATLQRLRTMVGNLQRVPHSS